MARTPRSTITRPDGTGRVVRVGLSGEGLADLYHLLLRTSWPRFLGATVILYLLVNAVFGLVFWLVGGVENMGASFLDAFFFSVQTFGTIGYGRLAPVTLVANAVVVAEAFLGMLSVALMTGLVFAKFARPHARVLWAKVLVVNRREGAPCLMVRMANERAVGIAEAQLRLSMLVNETSPEGERMRRMYDLPLLRASTPIFAFSFTAVHRIDAQSPLFGKTAGHLAAVNAQLVCTLVGIDETLSATVHARRMWLHQDVRWGHRYVDILAPLQDGGQQVDYTRFHQTEPEAVSTAQ